jgi:hypothetical protein
VVGVFAGDDVRDQRLGRQSTSISRAGADASTIAPSQAGQAYLGRRTTSTRSLRRDHVEPLGEVLADPMGRCPHTAWTEPVVDVDRDLDARQMRGQRTAVHLARSGSADVASDAADSTTTGAKLSAGSSARLLQLNSRVGSRP